MATFQFGTDGGDHVHVIIQGRPDENDDWLDATVSLHAGAFIGSFETLLMTCDFPPFRRQLEQLYATLSGSASFTTIEQQLQIRCSGNGLGGIEVSGVARDHVSDGNELRFRFAIDQTFLKNILADLEEIEQVFPNKLRPSRPQ